MQHSLSPMTAEGERRWNGFAPVLCSESDRMEPGRFQGVKQASSAYSSGSVTSRSRKSDFPDASDTSIRHSGVSLS
jgi:hypothetical protein